MKIKATLIKIISSERNIILKYFQRCDSYCLLTQTNFKHVSELGNLTLERLAFFKVKLNDLGLGEPLEYSFQEITYIFVQCKANLAQSSFDLKSIK